MKRTTRGFTLIELIGVMILVGILATIGVGRMMDTRETDAALYANRLRTMMRYAQKTAIAQQRPIYVQLATDLVSREARAMLCYDVACSKPVPAPGGMNSGTSKTLTKCVSSTWYCEAQPSGITVTYNTTSPIFWFNANGMPFDFRDATTATQSTYSQINVGVTAGTTVNSVLVEPVTGYVR